MNAKLFKAGVVLLGLQLAAWAQKANSGHNEQAHEHEEEGHEHHGAAEGEESVRFEEGHGLRLNEAVRDALAIETTAIEERSMEGRLRVIAQVYALKPEVLASARVVQAKQSEKYFETLHAPGVTLLSVEKIGGAVSNNTGAELILRLEAAPKAKVGDFLDIAFSTAPELQLAVARTALLDAASGKFVYVKNGDDFLRTAVSTGAETDDYVAITAGVEAGQQVVTRGVEQLWLTELRLTKGGGHSH